MASRAITRVDSLPPADDEPCGQALTRWKSDACKSLCAYRAAINRLVFAQGHGNDRANTAAASAYTVTAEIAAGRRPRAEGRRRDGAASGTASAALVSLSDESRLLAELAARDPRGPYPRGGACGGRWRPGQGAASFTFQVGRMGGAMRQGRTIDISPASTPEETLAKANQIPCGGVGARRTPAQDRQVAAQAAAMAQQARAEDCRPAGRPDIAPMRAPLRAASGRRHLPDSMRAACGATTFALQFPALFRPTARRAAPHRLDHLLPPSIACNSRNPARSSICVCGGFCGRARLGKAGGGRASNCGDHREPLDARGCGRGDRLVRRRPRAHLLPDWETLPYDSFRPTRISSRAAGHAARDRRREPQVIIRSATTALYRLARPPISRPTPFFLSTGRQARCRAFQGIR